MRMARWPRWRGRGSGAAALEAELAKRTRPASFPFVSGDTFRALADLVVDETGLEGRWVPGGTAFCATKYADQLLEASRDPDVSSACRSMSVVVHNGDIPPTLDALVRLRERFGRVFSVNVTADMASAGVVQVPIGLENLHWANNGRLEFFDPPFAADATRPLAERLNTVLASFNVRTNEAERIPLRQLSQAAGCTWREPGDGVAEYVAKVRDSVYVLSPRGNGLDCHRTWEAIYLGAIPVVTRGTLTSDLTDGLPVLVVDNWEAFFAMSRAEQLETAEILNRRSRASAYMRHWCAVLAGPSSASGR